MTGIRAGMGEIREWEQLVFFKGNRVYRVYEGGLLFHDLMGAPAQDSHYPENTPSMGF